MNIKLFAENDIKQHITMFDAITTMKNAFLQLANHQVQQPLRTMIPIKHEQAISVFMPAFLEEKKQLGIKIASSFPNNKQHNLPTINGMIILLDANTGIPTALMDAAYLTALRTGAVAGLATKYLAKEDATTLAIIGCGAQAHSQLEAIASVRDIKTIHLWSRHHDNAQTFAKKIENRFEVHTFTKIHQATCEADIICTITPSESPLIHLSDIKPDVHINAMGSHAQSMREITIDVMKQAHVIVDQKTATLSEAGEIIHAIENHAIRPEKLLELGNLLQNSPMDLKHKLTVFKSVGLAIQDISIAHQVYQNYRKTT